MLMKTDEVARFLTSALKETWRVRQVYYLLDMGVLEAIHTGVEWRVWPFSVREYVESRIKGTTCDTGDHFDYTAGRGLLFLSRYDGLPNDLPQKTLRIQSGGRPLEHPSGGPAQVLQQQLKPLVQFEFDLSA